MESNYYKEIEKYLVEEKAIFKFGSIGDGGYYLKPSTITNSNVLFSGGISSNIEFEYDIFRFNNNIKIVMVDPTVSILKLLTKGILRIFLLKKNKLKYIFNSLIFLFMLRSKRAWHIKKWLNNDNKIFDILASKINPSNDQNIILKLDIEGSEYDLLDEIITNQDLFSCMIFEFHDLDKKHNLLLNFLENCKKKFDLVYLEINPSGGFDSLKRPKNIEITLEKK